MNKGGRPIHSLASDAAWLKLAALAQLQSSGAFLPYETFVCLACPRCRLLQGLVEPWAAAIRACDGPSPANGSPEAPAAPDNTRLLVLAMTFSHFLLPRFASPVDLTFAPSSTLCIPSPLFAMLLSARFIAYNVALQ
ncbi:hypothetical protein CDD82_5075 [Ophiocordyceps australis]|uniref:Uncharacterized protein n=1 Tax=Ophiocordyceps australis TaxID=1399860 RepID=A0A2C5ZSB0_9HYPO|nr:hypothetical protein CDD82_5075 [Ophiocordyceps australis]